MWLTPDDWAVVEFYQRVADQWINQTPMGTEKGKPPVLTPRLEGYEAALRVYDYPRKLWPSLMSGAVTLHNLVHGADNARWIREGATARALDQIDPEELFDGC